MKLTNTIRADMSAGNLRGLLTVNDTCTLKTYEKLMSIAPFTKG